MDKIYLAVTRGFVEPGGEIDSPLVSDARARKRGQQLKHASTRYERLAAVELGIAVGRYPTARYSLVAVYPRTGRTHQIRRHFHHVRHPLVGDTTYGDLRHNRFFRDHFGCRRLLLAALELRLDHPRTGKVLHLSAPLESSFGEVLQQIGWLDRLPAKWRPESFHKPAL